MNNKNALIVYSSVAYFILGTVLVSLISYKPFSDTNEYHTLAVEISETLELYPHQHNLNDRIIWPSFYINALGILYSLTSPSLLTGKLFNVVLASLQLIALLKIVMIIFPVNNGVPQCCALLFCTYPNVYFTNILITTEPLFITCLLFGFLFYLDLISNRGNVLRKAALSGTCITCSVLVRPVALLVPIFMVAFLFMRKVRPAAVCTFIACVSVVYGAYGAIAKSKIGHFNAIGTTGGYNLLLSFNPFSYGRYSPESVSYVHNLPVGTMNVFEKNSYYTKLAVRFIIEQPLQALQSLVYKIFFLFMYDGKQIEAAFNMESQVSRISLKAILAKLQNSFSWIIILNQIIYVNILAMIFWGARNLLSAGETQSLFLLSAVPCLLLALTLLALASTRFHYPIVISGLPIASYGLYTLYKKQICRA